MNPHPHKATYWSAGTTDLYGNVAYTAPVVIDVRWEDKTVLFIDNEGEEANSESIIYTDQELDRKGYLFLGESTVTTPKSVDGAHQIKGRSKLTNLAGTKTIYKAWL